MPASKIYKQQQQQLLPAGPDVELDARLKYWINSVPLPSCALVNGIEDLRDGTVASDLASFVLGKRFPRLNTLVAGDELGNIGLIRSVIVSLASAHSWKNTPELLRQSDAPEKIVKGDKNMAIALVKFIKDVWEAEQQHPPRQSAPPFGPGSNESSNAVSSVSVRTATARSGGPQASTPTDRHNRIKYAPTSMKYEQENQINHREQFSYSSHDSDSFSDNRAVLQSIPIPRVAPISAARRADIILWLESLGVTSACTARRRTVHSSAHAHCRSERMDPLSDPWCNGVLLSELAAVLCKAGNKRMIKENNPACSCKAIVAHNSISSVNLTPRTTSRGVPARDLTTGSGGHRLLPGCAVHDEGAGAAWARDQPRIVLVGTEVHVKSLAQVLQNFRIALSALSSPNVTGLNKAILLPETYSSKENLSEARIDGLDCSAEDLCCGRVSVWDILSRLYEATQGWNVTPIGAHTRGRSCSPTSRGMPLKRPQSPKRPRSADARARKWRVRFEDEKRDDGLARPHTTFKSVSQEDMFAVNTVKDKSATRISGKSLTLSAPNQKKGESIHSRPPGDFSHVLSKTIDHVISLPSADSNKKPAPTVEAKNQSQNTRSQNTDVLRQDFVDYFPSITNQQQEAIRLWLMGLGLDVKDGCGGYYSSQQRVALDALSPSITQDRLRNGVLLCDLALLLEPNAATHTNIPQLARRMPKSLDQARSIIKSAFLFFQVRKCPPIPEFYFKNIDYIIRGQKDVLWGLLWEIMQAYPTSTTHLLPIESGNLAIPDIVSECCAKKISQEQRKASEVFEWIRSCIRLPALPIDVRPIDSLVSLEGVIRDGTLLCELGKEVLQVPMNAWCRNPKTYSQCIANVRKAIVAFQSFAASRRVHLQNRSEVEIVKGNWGEILSLLYDIVELHRGNSNNSSHCCTEAVSIPTEEPATISDLAPLPNTRIDDFENEEVIPENDIPEIIPTKHSATADGEETISQRLIKEIDAAMKTSSDTVKVRNKPINHSADLLVRGKVEIDSGRSDDLLKKPLPVAGTPSLASPKKPKSMRPTASQALNLLQSASSTHLKAVRKEGAFGAALECILPHEMVLKVAKVSSWLVDVGVDVRPLEELLSVVHKGSIAPPSQGENKQARECHVGYMAPLPTKKSKKDISTMLCEVIFQLWHRSLIALPTEATPSQQTGNSGSVSIPPGCTAFPRSPAQRRQNVRRALSTLGANNKIPLKELMCEDEILMGNVESLIRLLSVIRQYYSNKVNC